MVIYPATRDEIEMEDEDNATAVHWANCELAKLLKLTPEQKRGFDPFGYEAEFIGDDALYTLAILTDEQHEAESLELCIDQWLAEVDPVRNALIEIRHKLRKQS